MIDQDEAARSAQGLELGKYWDWGWLSVRVGAYPIVRKEHVKPEMARVVSHVVHPTVREVAEHIGVVESCHGDLAAAHFQEGTEGGEDALVRVKIRLGPSD